MAYIKTKEQARQYAIDWQVWQSDKNLSYEEVIHFQKKLTTLAKRFGLMCEFKENAII